MNLKSKLFAISAVVLIAALNLALLVHSAYRDAPTFDEITKIPAGLSYLTEQQYRMNPSHPPGMKIITAVPLLFLNPALPTDDDSWRESNERRFGERFFFKSGNDPQQLVFYARLGAVSVSLIFFIGFFLTVRWKWGLNVALISSALLFFSPTYLAHARLANTDLAATLGFFFGIFSFTALLKHPSLKNFLVLVSVSGLALLMKFSTLFLFCCYAALAIIWAFCQEEKFVLSRFAKKVVSFGAISGLCLALSLSIVWLVYGLLTLNYPLDIQARDMASTVRWLPYGNGKSFILGLLNYPILRGLAEYLAGLSFLIGHFDVGAHHEAYLLGEAYERGRWYFFPVTFFIKETLPFLVLLVSGAFVGLISFFSKLRAESFRFLLRENFEVVAAVVFILAYGTLALGSSLNLGIRHLLPLYPFMAIVVALSFRSLLNKSPLRWTLVTLLTMHLVLSSLATPNYISYCNFAVGGSDDCWRLVADSNFDWGQDINKLSKELPGDLNTRVAVDYFSGTRPKPALRYYLGERAETWNSFKGKPKPGSLVAISAHYLAVTRAQEGRRKPEQAYEWTEQAELVGRAGKSILLFRAR